MSDPILFDAAGRRRSPATMPGHHRGRSPRNKGRQYPADPPTTEEIVAVMRCAGAAPHGLRTRALVVLLWRAGLRVSEALAVAESDLDRSTGGVLVRLGKGGKRRHVGMERWGWQQLQPWLDCRIELPVGAIVGELGMLSPSNARTQTLECVESGTILSVSYSKVEELYVQNPEFGFYFLRLASARLFQNIGTLEQRLEQQAMPAAAPSPA